MTASQAKPSGFRTILGVKFFAGSVEDAVTQVLGGGLLVVPAAPALALIDTDHDYRNSLLSADTAIADSVLMTLVWNIVTFDRLPKISGLLYLRRFLKRPEVMRTNATFWIMATDRSASRNIKYLNQIGLPVTEADCYVAPMYGASARDEVLLGHVERLRPDNIVISIGGGTQEKLGLFLRDNLSYRPGIHCIGAALAFLSGDQAPIPHAFDILGLGWLIRCLSNPGLYVPRYVRGLRVVPLVIKYRSQLPPWRGVPPDA